MVDQSNFTELLEFQKELLSLPRLLSCVLWFYGFQFMT